MRRALRSALEGNLTAAKFVTDRVCGKAAEAKGESEPLEIALPNMKTAAACTAAVDKVAVAVTAGTIDPVKAKLLLDIIQTRLKAIEVNDLETRLAELEKTAASVDTGGSRGTRRF